MSAIVTRPIPEQITMRPAGPHWSFSTEYWSASRNDQYGVQHEVCVKRDRITGEPKSESHWWSIDGTKRTFQSFEELRAYANGDKRTAQEEER